MDRILLNNIRTKRLVMPCCTRLLQSAGIMCAPESSRSYRHSTKDATGLSTTGHRLGPSLCGAPNPSITRKFSCSKSLAADWFSRKNTLPPEYNLVYKYSSHNYFLGFYTASVCCMVPVTLMEIPGLLHMWYRVWCGEEMVFANPNFPQESLALYALLTVVAVAAVPVPLLAAWYLNTRFSRIYYNRKLNTFVGTRYTWKLTRQHIEFKADDVDIGPGSATSLFYGNIRIKGHQFDINVKDFQDPAYANLMLGHIWDEFPRED